MCMVRCYHGDDVMMMSTVFAIDFAWLQLGTERQVSHFNLLFVEQECRIKG